MTFTQKNLHRKDHAILVGLIKISGSVKLHTGDSWGRKVTTHKCPHINVLNVETEPRMGDGEN